MGSSRGTIRFVCSHCIASLEAKRRQAGTRMRCPWCQTILIVPQESRPETPAETYALAEGPAAPAEAASEPGLYVTCPVCRTRMHAAIHQVGQSLVCPDCGTSTVVPAPGGEPVKPSEPPAPPAPVEIYDVAQGEGQPPPSDQEVYRRYIPVVCLLCRTRMLATEEQVGQMLVCPDCGTANVVPPLAGVAASATSAPEPPEIYALAEPVAESRPQGPAAPRLYLYKCPTCHTRLHATQAEAGQATTCPDCGTRFTIPPPPAAEPGWDPFQEAEQTYPVARIEQHAALDAQDAKRPSHPDSPKSPGKVRIPAERELLPPRPRPKPPPWPLVNGVFTFPFRRDLLLRWVLLTAGMVLVWHMLMATITRWEGALASGGFVGGFAAAAFAVSWLLFTAFIGVIYLVGASIFLVAVLTETANGLDEMPSFPGIELLDRLFDVLYLVNSGVLSVAVGWPMDRYAGQWTHGFATPVAVFFLFPVFLLSMLETGSVVHPFSRAVWGGLFTECLAWMAFYWLSGFLVAAVGGLALASWRAMGAASPLLVAPVAAAALIIYFRLLGRLGWYCVERARNRARSSED